MENKTYRITGLSEAAVKITNLTLMLGKGDRSKGIWKKQELLQTFIKAKIKEKFGKNYVYKYRTTTNRTTDDSLPVWVNCRKGIVNIDANEFYEYLYNNTPAALREKRINSILED